MVRDSGGDGDAAATTTGSGGGCITYCTNLVTAASVLKLAMSTS